MRLEEFHDWLKTQPIEDKLVYMRYKYPWEDGWTYSHEYLEVDCSIEDYYIWLNDWYEGQDDVEIFGCIDVDKIDVPLFETHAESEDEELKKILDIIHKTISQFFDICGEDEESPMTYKDKLLLKVNKAICNNLKRLEKENKDGD